MGLTIRNWSLGKKLIAAEALLVLLLLSAFTFYVYKYSETLLENSHIDDMKRQVNLAKGMLEVYENTVSHSTEKFSNVFTSYFPERFKLDLCSYECRAEGTKLIELDRTETFTHLRLRPHIRIRAGAEPPP